ncbi:Signal transducer regulating beta-lactamase production, contains metallopeptidase domain [Aquiflexum balticum DSM 16537]|uniref:Signal transducer regulating beta-lactamase production, contains metallopeptidase domain n=1 Tax=Aquiflexum balticum DSM 16537 TaxID=758820 RepID=A0A1W2GYH3_9BACT|nr:M56 family metallopeptidase [Aquiflexum balticum]SMD41703.1 Signal transducer regulating beta-lactamase production, contains metallopeptidase domain [Aquiflexum balticum DSM 16537]
MEILETVIPEKYLFALGWMIIHALWQIASLGLILWLLLKAFQSKSAAFKYRLSVGILFLVTTLAIGTFFYHIQDQPSAKEFAFNPTEMDHFLSQGVSVNSSNNNHYSVWQLLTKSIESWIPYMVQFWILGAMLFLVRFGASLADLRNISIKNHEQVDPEWMNIFQRQLGLLNLNNPIKLLKTIHLDMPVTYGIWKPVILIPASLFFQLSPAQLEAILAHELSHIKRYDYLVNLLQSFLEVVFFFHPVFWWINKTARELRENACDDMAIKMGILPKDLAHGLANVLNHSNKPAPEIALAAAKTKNPTLDRIKRIMGVKNSPIQPTTLTSITMMITLLIGATLMVGASDKKTVESWEDLMITSLTSKTIDSNWENGFQRLEQDTVTIKKEPNIVVDKTLHESQSIPELETIQKNLEENPFKELGMMLRDMDFGWAEFSNMPQIKIGSPLVPPMDFDSIPTLEFDEKMFEQMVPDSDFFKNVPTADLPMFDADLFNFSFDQNFFRNDTSKMTKEEIRKWKEKHQAEMEKWAEAQKEFHSKMEPKMKEFQDKMREWEKANEPKMQEFKLKMEEWQQEFQNNLQPKMEEYQAKMQEWQKANEPKMKEFELKMKAWQEENQPKIEEFQKKMEIWQQENQEKMKEFQMKMQEWQKENQEKMQQLEKSQKEKSKKEMD